MATTTLSSTSGAIGLWAGSEIEQLRPARRQRSSEARSATGWPTGSTAATASDKLDWRRRGDDALRGTRRQRPADRRHGTAIVVRRERRRQLRFLLGGVENQQ